MFDRCADVGTEQIVALFELSDNFRQFGAN
jgi:hypothetical protein